MTETNRTIRRKIAIMYDFDQTLCTKNMQEYSLIPSLKQDASEFWGSVSELARKDNMDPILAYMYMMLKKAREMDLPVKRAAFQSQGKDIEYYQGVKEYFPRINAYGKEKGIEIQHYIISSGTREIIEGCDIYDEFTRVFASEFHYDENGNADWPSLAIDYTGKTQFLYRINKNALDIYDSTKVNSRIAADQKDIPFDHMIYLGDGMTDVPCMTLVKANGGYSIGVYPEDNQKVIRTLLNEERVSFACKADYRENGQLDTVIKDIISMIAAKDRLNSLLKDDQLWQ